MPFKRCIILLADGARPDVMGELASAGQLPNISEIFISKGTFLKAATVFPSTTGPAHLPFLTGSLPATCNIPGIRWFDKKLYGRYGHGSSLTMGAHSRYRSYVGFETFRINSDMRNDVYTSFEIIPDSYSIFNSINRGVGSRNLTKVMRIWYWYYGHLTGRWAFVDDAAMEKTLAAVEKDFKFLFVVIPGIDEYSHFNHFKDAKTIGQYKFLDEFVGKLSDKLKSENKSGETLLWIVSDHGLTATHKHFCVNTFLENRGIRTFFYPLIYRKKFDAVNMVSGNGMTHLYFKKGDCWTNPANVEDIELIYPKMLDDLLAEEAIDLIAAKSETGEIVVRTKRGRAKMRMEGEHISYYAEGSDPFGYESLGNYFTARESLEKTINSDYPDAIYQLLHIFTSPRCGDVVLSAKPGFDLRLKYEHPEHKGSHGSLHKDHMLVPVLCNTKINASAVRTVDVFPTYLKLMGYDIPANVDGVSLI